MTLQEWTPLYSRLCAGLGRKETPAQMRAYYDALSDYSVLLVTEAVKSACVRVWPPTHPHAGELRELARQHRNAHSAPAATCDLCHGEGWIIVPGASQVVRMPNPRHGAEPHYLETSWTPDLAQRCPQCRPGVSA